MRESLFSIPTPVTLPLVLSYHSKLRTGQKGLSPTQADDWTSANGPTVQLGVRCLPSCTFCNISGRIFWGDPLSFAPTIRRCNGCAIFETQWDKLLDGRNDYRSTNLSVCAALAHATLMQMHSPDDPRRTKHPLSDLTTEFDKPDDKYNSA